MFFSNKVIKKLFPILIHALGIKNLRLSLVFQGQEKRKLLKSGLLLESLKKSLCIK